MMIDDQPDAGPPAKFDPSCTDGEAAIGTGDVAELERTVPGAAGTSPLSFPFAAWWSIVKRVYVMTGFHNLSLLAAGVAFFSFLAFVPLIASIVLIYGLVGDPRAVTDNIIMLGGILPGDVLRILQEQMLAIITSSQSAKGIGLVIAIFVALYGAMRSATAMIAALNIIYEEHETRNLIRTTLVAARITGAMVGVALVGTAAITVLTYTSVFLAGYLGNVATLLINAVTWLLAALLTSLTFAFIFRVAPDRRAAKWRWLSVGSILSTVLWLAITLGFGFYVASISNYNATYGSLGAVVVFLMWLFLSAYAVLIGAEFNSEMERQTMVDSTIGPDRPIGMRGAVMADSIVVNEASRALLEKKRRREAAKLASRAS